ncbi:MAG: type II toxin-antitoxin system VapC family toxin [Acetobacteraceae bacterium]
MNFLLDTNVVSEWVKPRPDPGVVAWVGEADEDRIFISVITIAELRHGIERLPVGVRRDRLDHWLTEQVPLRFGERVLAVDAETADAWGRVMAPGEATGRSPGTMDAFIAATVLQHDMTLVTRNASDFEPLGLRMINPWRNG